MKVVKSVTIHHGYDFVENINDIAILKLMIPLEGHWLTDLSIACLHTDLLDSFQVMHLILALIFQGGKKHLKSKSYYAGPPAPLFICLLTSLLYFMTLRVIEMAQQCITQYIALL